MSPRRPLPQKKIPRSRPTLAPKKKSPTRTRSIADLPMDEGSLILSEGSSVASEAELEAMDVQQDQGPQPEPATAAAIPDDVPLPKIEVQPIIDRLPTAAGTALPSTIVYYSKDEFAEFFGGMFQLAGLGFSMAPPLHRPMTSLVTARQLPSFRPACDAIYDLAQKHEWMRWLIDKTSDDLKAFMFIGLFALGVGIGVKEELNQRRNLIAKLEEEYEREQSDEKEPAAHDQGNEDRA